MQDSKVTYGYDSGGISVVPVVIEELHMRSLLTVLLLQWNDVTASVPRGRHFLAVILTRRKPRSLFSKPGGPLRRFATRLITRLPNALNQVARKPISRPPHRPSCIN